MINHSNKSHATIIYYLLFIVNRNAFFGIKNAFCLIVSLYLTKNYKFLTTKGEKMRYDSEGYIQFNAFTAGGALPVPEISIRITGSEEENIDTDYTVFTGRDGTTETVPLPAPSISYSLSPNPSEHPYAKYSIEAYGKGFYPKRLEDVSVFSGIKSILPLEMIPDAKIVKNVNPPYSANNSYINENEDLS